EEQEQAPVSTGGSRLADADVSQVDSSLFEGLPRSAAPMLEYAVTRNPDTVADAQKIAKRTGMDADFVEQNYDQLSAQDRAERQQRLMETMDAGGTMYFMRDPVNAGMAHDDLENLIRIEQESNPFRALGKTAGRAVPKVFQFYNQSMAYLSGTLDSVEHGIGDALGTGHTGIFKRSEQFHLAQSKYINDEVLNSELLALPEHVTKSLWDNPQLLVNPEYLVTQVGEAASSMLPMVAAYTVSGGSLAVPSVVGGLQEAASLYEDLVRDGVDQADAATAATSFGVVVGLLNKVGLEELTRKIPTKTIMQNLARRGAAGAAEGFTEYLEEPFQAAFSALAKGKDMDGVVSDVIASLKNVDVAVGAIILGSSGGVSKVAERVEDKRQAGLLATQNGVQLSALSDAVAKSKLAERSPEALGEFINSVFPTEASEQFVDAQQFATLFQEGIEEGQDVGTVEEVLSRLEVTPEAFGKALEQGSVMPLSIPKLMQHCTKEERELIIPHMKANPLAMSEAESVQTDWQAEAKSQVQQYEPDMELEAALDTERSRIVQGLVGQGIREDEAETMAAIPHAFAKSYSTYGLDGVDFLRRMHVGEVETAQGNVSTELSQAAMRRSEAVTVQEFLEESRAGERVFYEGKPSPEAVARALELSDLRVNLPYDFVQHVDKKRPNHTDSLVAKVDEVLENATFVGRLEGGKARASRYVAILEEGENATAVVFDLSKKKAMHIARPVTAFANSKEKVRAHFREAIPKEAGSGVHGMNTLTNENISNAEGEVKTKLKQGQRGSLSFLPDNNYLIKLSSSADSSTFVHECAHIFLAELSRMTGQTQVFGDTVFEGDSATIVPERVLQDMEQLRSWFGLAEGEAIEAEHQEQFARGFEAYLREGEAPSPELSHVFHRFRQWLLSIYKSVKSLNVTINDDVRDVFDRMLATDEQVEAARNRASITRESDEMLRQLGATEEDIALRERLDVEAEREAIAFMDRQTLRERQRRRKQAELDAKKLVEDEPVYKAILNLAAGRGLDEDYLLEYHGEVTFAAIRKTHRGIIKKNGQHGDLAAVEFGFDDANQFVDALLAAPRRKARIEEVAAELLEAEDAKANHALAENIASGKAFGDFLELKAKIYSRKLQSQTYSRREHLQKSAKDSLAFTPVGEAMRYDRHQYTVRRQSELREEAERAGNANKAAFHLNKERTAHEFVGEAIRLRDRVRSVQERFKNYAKSNVIENHHRDHLRDVLIRFGFTAGMDSLKPRNPDHMLPLVELIESHGDMMGDIPQFDDWLIRDGTPVHWRDLTVAELQQVENLISFLQHKGKQLYKEKEQAYQNELANTVRKCVAAMEGRSRKVHNKLSLKRKFNDTVDAWTSRLETFFFHMDRADGYTSIGKNGTRGANVGLHDRLVDSQDAETRQLDVAKEKLVSAVSTLYNFRRRLEKKYGTKGFTSVEIDGEAVELSLPHAMQKDGRKWTPDAIIGALLHSGSASNLKRLINGYKYIDGVYQKGAPSIPIAMFQRMVTHEELNAIQTIWDVIESTYERVDKAHYAKNGFHIGKVEAQPFSVTVDGKTKTYRGGYMPAVADRSFPESAGLQRQTEFSELLANPEAVHQNAAPKSSFTKNRTGARYPLKLSLDVAINHIYDAIHYSTHAENIQFVDKVTRDPEWKDAHIDAFGQKAYEAVRGILKNTARPEVRSNDAESNLASKLREHATPYILALNFSVAAKQVFSIFGGIHDMGFVDFTKGLKNVFGSNPRKQMQFIHDVSPYMKSRFTSMEEEFARLGGKIGIEAPLISAFGKDISKQDIANLGFWPIRAMDMATTYVLWTSAYEKAMKKGQSMEEAVRYADDIVRRSQPSSQPIDKIMFQIEGGDFKRLFSMFITFTVRTFGARATHHYRAMREGGMTKAEYAAYVLYDHLLPPIAMHLAFALMWGDAPDPDDDEALAAFMLDMGCGVAGYQLSRFPFLPSVFSNFDAFGSPAAAGPDLIQQLVTDVKNIVTDDKANAHEKLLISMAHAMSYYLKIPVSKAVQRMKKGTEQFLNDEGTVANILIPEPKR
ncbi:hypothetical protein SP90_12175, partial [Halodesulfovibrio spirochaetisodalis]